MRTFGHFVALMGLNSLLFCSCSKQPASQTGSAQTNALSFYVVSGTAIPGADNRRQPSGHGMVRAYPQALFWFGGGV